ncbi:MAG: hypothetical protein FWF02_14185 [Micrococcales bacterium]|nr:hypothetical protein [Micrococcales bacterium]MCL2668826.1 hypothetical protein [Micrococcales bacterium]
MTTVGSGPPGGEDGGSGAAASGAGAHGGLGAGSAGVVMAGSGAGDEAPFPARIHQLAP